MLKQAFNSWQSHAGGTSPSLCLATDQIMLKSSRENWIRSPCCSIVGFFLFSSLHILKQCYALFLLCNHALWGHILSFLSPLPLPSLLFLFIFPPTLQRITFSFALQSQSWPLPWSPWSLIREAKCNISTAKLAFFSLPLLLSCCFV